MEVVSTSNLVIGAVLVVMVVLDIIFSKPEKRFSIPATLALLVVGIVNIVVAFI